MHRRVPTQIEEGNRQIAGWPRLADPVMDRSIHLNVTASLASSIMRKAR